MRFSNLPSKGKGGTEEGSGGGKDRERSIDGGKDRNFKHEQVSKVESSYTLDNPFYSPLGTG